MTEKSSQNRLFSRGSWPEAQRIAERLRADTVGGVLLLVASLAALVWANSPWRDAYTSLGQAHLGKDFLGLHLDLSLAHWSADGLLAVFFFVVGLELKHEFVVGDLKDKRRAAVPIIAAACGVIVPALVYVLINVVGNGDLAGWAIPSATDIAFAVAVLAVIGTHLPSGLRSFLLTLAVVDDLIAILIIAIFFTEEIKIGFLLGALLLVALFGYLAHRGVRKPLILIPIGVICWVFMLSSGIHATIAGVLLGLVVPAATNRFGTPALCTEWAHRWQPISAGLCVPIFAFFAAGVTFIGGGFTTALSNPITLGIIFGLVLGKVIGIFGSTFLLAKFTKADLDSDLSWSDVFGMSLLGGIGFTVALLVGELAFGTGSEADEFVKIGVLTGSFVSAILGAIVLTRRNRHYRTMHEKETVDSDSDGIPDVYDDQPNTPNNL
ncbi:Na+/H+ antiporter NhaA [Demetria terragena]|uniref:Na+/H+ antiporter NhaA n=1 Tax=Demetria terragena TaxID=63959 RepID=UPI00036740A2|nr:Na+/H+ antiporter NhaA [Demetria terragena]